MTERWTERTDGVLLAETLELRANRAGAFGGCFSYPGGSVRRALFTYLCGEPREDLLFARPELFFGGWLVCTSSGWAALLREQPLETVLRRVLFRPRSGPSGKELPPLPPGYTLTRWTPEIFAGRPFGQGGNYRGFEDFSRRGAGAAVLRAGEAVASASSFLTFEQGIELDVSTDPVHRGKGLADHCVSALLADCADRGLAVHWDAQNGVSAHMALSHGFAVEQEYAVYVLKNDAAERRKA